MNYSYVTLLSDDSYIYGIILLLESLKRVNAQYPLEVLITSNVSQPILEIIHLLLLNYLIVKPIKSDALINYNKTIEPHFAKTWALCLTKFEIFNLVQYDKIIFLDADIMVMKNLDHLFEYPHLTSALDGEYFNLWPNNPHLNAGILVIKPNIEEYQQLIEFSTNLILDEERKIQCIADQEILNMYYSDWANKPELHLNKYYDVFAPYIQEDQIDDIENNCYFIHYIGRKPWRGFFKVAGETYTEEYYNKARAIITEITNLLNWDKAKHKIKIAIYGICKDEIANVEKYLKCFSKADYLCILDTGSTDGTWEYLQSAQLEYNNLIIELKIIDPWRYDTARNLSLSLVPSDTTMYFMMDLDEIIKEDNWCFYMKASWDPLFSRGSYIYHRLVDKVSDVPILSFKEYRIHNNGWHYEGIVHEQLCNIVGARSFTDDECLLIPIAVWHYPIHMNRDSYIKLCEQAIKEEPNNWIMHLLLAAEYEVHELYDKAIDEYKTIIISQENLSTPELGRCYASLGRILNLINKTEEGLHILEKGRTLFPDYGDNYFIAAEIYYNLLQYERAYQLCVEGIKNNQNNYWCTIVDSNSYLPYLIMGMALYYLGNIILALGYLTIAKEKNNNENTDNAYTLVLNDILRR